MEILILILATLALTWRGFTSRMSGGGWPKTPWIWDRFLYALPDLLFWPWISFWAVPAWIVSAFAKRMGTAPFLDMGHDQQPTDKVSIITWFLKPLKGRISNYWYDFSGNAILGFFHGFPLAGVLLAFHWYIPAALVISGGVARCLAYSLGWVIIPNYENKNLPESVNQATKIAEILSGVFDGAGRLAAIVWLVLA